MLKRFSSVSKSFIVPLTDDKVAAFTEWNWDGWQNVGMRHVNTGKRHGVVRRITKFGHIGEASFKEGKCHGLNREISDKKITIELRKDGQKLAHFVFDFNFNELERKDEQGFLNSLSAQDFMNQN